MKLVEFGFPFPAFSNTSVIFSFRDHLIIYDFFLRWYKPDPLLFWLPLGRIDYFGSCAHWTVDEGIRRRFEIGWERWDIGVSYGRTNNVARLVECWHVFGCGEVAITCGIVDEVGFRESGLLGHVNNIMLIIIHFIYPTTISTKLYRN